MNIDFEQDHRSTTAEHEHSSDKGNELAAVASRAVHSMTEYAQVHNVSIEGTHADAILTEKRRPRLVITVPKYIAQEHRDALEELAFRAAASSHLKPEVQFIYEQSAG